MPTFRVFIIVKLYFTYAIFASFALQFYVPMDFLEPPFFSRLKLDKLTYYFPRFHNQVKLAIQLAFRTFLVVLIGEGLFTCTQPYQSTTVATFTIHLNGRQVLVPINPHWKVL